MRSVNIKLTDRSKDIRAEIKAHSRLDYPAIDAILMQWAISKWKDIPAFMSPMEKLEASR